MPLLDVLERGLVTVTLEYNLGTLPRPTEHRVLSDSIRGKNKEGAANKQYVYLKDISDCIAPANQT